MAIGDYGDLYWKNGEPINRNEEDEKLIYSIDGNIKFTFYKYLVTITNIKENKEVTIFPECGNTYHFRNGYRKIYRKYKYDIFNQVFTVDYLEGGAYLFETFVNGDRYQVVFGYGIDLEWYKYKIPEMYEYSNKLLKFLNKHDNRNYHIDKNYKRNYEYRRLKDIER